MVTYKERLAASGSNGGVHLPSLNGRRILLAEDDCLLAFDLKEELIACGAEVIGPAHDVDSGFELAKSQLQIDAAVIDLNLAGEFAFHLVDELVRRGTPVIFTTGYDVEVVPYRLRHIARYMKPIPASEIAQGVADLILEQQSKAEQAPSTINRRSASQHGEFADHSHAHSEPRFMNVLLPRLIF